jgi:hypothetical protein
MCHGSEDRRTRAGDRHDIAEAHLTAVREKHRELHVLEHSIAGFIEAADVACPSGPGADCVVLEQLAEPAERYPG